MIELAYILILVSTDGFIHSVDFTTKQRCENAMNVALEWPQGIVINPIRKAFCVEKYLNQQGGMMKRFSFMCWMFGCEGRYNDICKECGGKVRDNPACGGWGGIGD